MDISLIHNDKTLLSNADLDSISKAGRSLGEAILLESDNPEEIFVGIKMAASEVKDVFTKLQDRMDRNEFAEISEKADRLGKLLEQNEIIGREVKTAGNIVGDLAKDIIAITGAALSGNFGAIPEAVSNTAIDLVYTGKLLVRGAHNFKSYYKAKLKPKMHKMKIKLEHKEEKVKDELKHLGKSIETKLDKAEHWIEKRLHIKNKDSKKKESDGQGDDKALVGLDHSEELVSVGLVPAE